MKGAKNIGNMSPAGVYNRVVCSHCGKEFTMPCECRVYPFRIGKKSNGLKYFCSWSCMRAYEREHPKSLSIYYDFIV